MDAEDNEGPGPPVMGSRARNPVSLTWGTSTSFFGALNSEKICLHFQECLAKL